MYVISYDISEDRMRRKIAKELQNYGVRIQYSVFECDLTAKRYKELYAKLVKLTLELHEGSIRIYTICQNCQEKIVTIGEPLNQLRQISEPTIVI